MDSIVRFQNHYKILLDIEIIYEFIFRCFKREFTEPVALRMWEACWANYQTDYFHLFLCLAIIAVYADDVIAQDLRTDEMLLYFSSLGIIKTSHKTFPDNYNLLFDITLILFQLCIWTDS